MDNREKCCRARKTSIGGQALMEGIMMRGPKKTVMAVRNPAGEMVLEECYVKPIFGDKIKKIPIIRGVFNFIDSMKVGYTSLMRSADISALEEIRQETAPDTEGLSEEEKEKVLAEQKKKDDKLMAVLMPIAMVLAIVISVGLFMYLPSLLFEWVFGFNEKLLNNTFLRSLFEGVLKILFFMFYMLAVSCMKEIKRTFMYHGAEHKTIFCYENGLELTVENVKKQSRFHPRCGTSFLIVMLIVSIFIGMLIPSSIGKGLRTVIRVILLPLTMGIGYEFIKFAGKHDSIIVRILSAPGLWFQRISTKEPDDGMIECAIAALKEVIPDDESDLIK